jgi:hypothetical protein
MCSSQPDNNSRKLQLRCGCVAVSLVCRRPNRYRKASICPVTLNSYRSLRHCAFSRLFHQQSSCSWSDFTVCKFAKKTWCWWSWQSVASISKPLFAVPHSTFSPSSFENTFSVHFSQLSRCATCHVPINTYVAEFLLGWLFSLKMETIYITPKRRALS